MSMSEPIVWGVCKFRQTLENRPLSHVSDNGATCSWCAAPLPTPTQDPTP